MRPVTIPSSAHLPARGTLAHARPRPHADRRHSTHSLVRARVAAGGGRAGGGGGAGRLRALTRVLLCTVGCVRQLDPRNHGAGGAAQQIRRPVQQGRAPQSRSRCRGACSTAGRAGAPSPGPARPLAPHAPPPPAGALSSRVWFVRLHTMPVATL
ncbi:hypothetical protein EVAR_20471_1 [Eumeta japonica]|uniref:Uncharacterized protein n=1 Tax=Eumeta variegata TaxID=151549 RepID=A0A4C1TY14_EUMVA|nr:hypothetical protein EVAR_20471_1 [Eumeta japonica]